MLAVSCISCVTCADASIMVTLTKSCQHCFLLFFYSVLLFRVYFALMLEAV